jgi:lipopolysaccharide/colanic/teichoic acid biosynthesis glycosyltransferase
MKASASNIAKRAFDLSTSVVALVALWPLLLIVAAYVKLCSPGPALFTQERIGRDGRPFRILKFRTMHVRRVCGDSFVSIHNDPRVFPGGRLLRKLKIDELPQLWNVIAGSMSLVGPRPTVDEDYRRMTPRQRSRWAVRPGITGLAQIRGGTSLLWPERIELDLEYIRKRSFWLDIKVLIATCAQVLTARADTHPAGDDEWSVAL